MVILRRLANLKRSRSFRPTLWRPGFVIVGMASNGHGPTAWSQGSSRTGTMNCQGTADVCADAKSTNVTLIAVGSTGNAANGWCCQSKTYTHNCVSGPNPPPPRTWQTNRYAEPAGNT